ncbi:MAG: hypothetical protein QY332_11455 [Anaerolineales bacterium]|nr:MAG: hypothetical protein QY332_11455 [Anaerolineales bacterium]
MAGKNTKNKKQTKSVDTNPTGQNRAAQILFIMFAVLIILSMVLSATTSY